MIPTAPDKMVIQLRMIPSCLRDEFLQEFNQEIWQYMEQKRIKMRDKLLNLDILYLDIQRNVDRIIRSEIKK